MLLECQSRRSWFGFMLYSGAFISVHFLLVKHVSISVPIELVMGVAEIALSKHILSKRIYFPLIRIYLIHLRAMLSNSLLDMRLNA